MASNLQPIATIGTTPPFLRPLLHVVERTRKSVPKVTQPRKTARNVTKSIKYLFYRKEAFCLRRAITLKTSRQGGFWIYSYNPLGITAYGRTKEESLSAFVMELSSAWHRIAQAPDDMLAPDALELKRKLTSRITSRPMREVLSELNQDA